MHNDELPIPEYVRLRIRLLLILESSDGHRRKWSELEEMLGATIRRAVETLRQSGAVMSTGRNPTGIGKATTWVIATDAGIAMLSRYRDEVAAARKASEDGEAC